MSAHTYDCYCVKCNAAAAEERRIARADLYGKPTTRTYKIRYELRGVVFWAEVTAASNKEARASAPKLFGVEGLPVNIISAAVK